MNKLEKLLIELKNEINSIEIKNDEKGLRLGQISTFSNNFILDSDFFKHNILVSLTPVNINSVLKDDYDDNNFNLVSSCYFMDSDKELDFLDKTFLRKVKLVYKENILLLGVTCETLEDLDKLNLNHQTPPLGTMEAAKEDNKFDLLSTIKFDNKNRVIYKEVKFTELLRSCKLNNKSIYQILNLLIDGNKKGYKILFYFKNVSWYKIIFALAKNRIYVSGGNPSKRHLLSSGQLILGIIISCLDKSYLSNITKSFNSDLKFDNRINFDSKKIIEYMKKYDFDKNVIKYLIGFRFYVEMYYFIEKSLDSYIKFYSPYFQKYEGIDNDKFSYLEISDTEDVLEKNNLKLLINNVKYYLDNNYELDYKNLPNYDYVKSLVYMRKYVLKTLDFYLKYLVDIKEILNLENKVNNEKLFKDISRFVDKIRVFDKTFTSNPQEIFKTRTPIKPQLSLRKSRPR